MNGVIELQLRQFLLIYLLLLLVGLLMKRCHINQTKRLLVASVRMTVQLVIAGLVLTVLFENPHPAFTMLYLAVMTGFAVYRVLSGNRDLNRRFKTVIALSICASGIFIMLFFICVVVGESMFNPQYVIPIAGMLMGNIMTGVSLGVKSFQDSLRGQRQQLNTLLCVGGIPRLILLPFVRQAMEMAVIPTLNSMIGMGIVSLPGMMTGQILSGTLPMTAILYQIAIMIAICAAVCLSCFGSLYFGYKTLYDPEDQIIRLK